MGFSWPQARTAPHSGTDLVFKEVSVTGTLVNLYEGRYMLISFLKRITLIVISLLITHIAFADAVTTTQTSSKSFIALRNLNMNVRSARDTNGAPLGVIGRGSILQLPDSFGVFQGSTGQLDLGATLANWENNTRDGRYSALAPKPCAGTMCVPVRVHKSSNPNIADGTIAYISLQYIKENINPSRYTSGRTELEITTNIANGETTTDPVVDGGEVTTPDTSDTSTDISTSEVLNCNNTVYRSSNYGRNSCLRNLSMTQQAELVMSDIIKVNQLVRAAATRGNFNLDPRVSVCMSFKESSQSNGRGGVTLSPNAKGGTPDWGMFQVIDSTGRGVLRRTPTVTPGFSGLSWIEYRNKMLKSTLAQADLHHNVLYHKARENNLLSSINAGTESTEVYRTLAKRYNGSGARATNYGNKVASCYSCMKGIATRAGKITNSGGLMGCLNRVK